MDLVCSHSLGCDGARRFDAVSCRCQRLREKRTSSTRAQRQRDRQFPQICEVLHRFIHFPLKFTFSAKSNDSRRRNLGKSGGGRL
jgi:hypothetical protein